MIRNQLPAIPFIPGHVRKETMMAKGLLLWLIGIPIPIIILIYLFT